MQWLLSIQTWGNHMSERNRHHPDNTVLIVVTSHDTLGETGEPTGFHYEELSTPYYRLTKAGYSVQIASPRGGKAPYDPSSLTGKESDRPESVRRFLNDAEAQRKIQNTIPLASINAHDFVGIYLPGGHGTMWDLPDNAPLQQLIASFDRDNKIIAAICHGPAAFINVREANSDEYFVNGRTLNSFTDAEEREAKKEEIVPFLLEETLRNRGAEFTSGKPGEGFATRDGNLITGQNPKACDRLSDYMLNALDERRKQREVA